MRVFIGPYPKGQRKRRISVKIDPFDTWSMDHTLSYIILPMLKKIKKDKHGVPSIFVNYDHHQMKDHDSKEFKKADNKALNDATKLWHAVLDKMIWSFNEEVSDHKGKEKFFKKIGKMKWSKPRPDGVSKLISTGLSMDKEGLRAYEERLQEGFDLFGKYFQNLWT